MVFILGRFVYYAKYMVSLFHIAKVKRRVFKKSKDNKVMNVVFIIQYVPSWNKLEPIYQKMKNDCRFNPSIVCVPMEIENHELKKLTNETYDYFVNKGYDVINAITGDKEWFDIRQLTPDFVFHSRPYNYVMPSCYTSDCIKKYALICNILYGPNLTENGQNVTINQDYFKDVFCYFAFEKSDLEFYKNRFWLGINSKVQCCYSYGAIGIEHILMSQSKKDNSPFRKTVLWTPRWSTDPYIGGSNFFKYIKNIVLLIHEFPDILFIIRPHPLMFENFVKNKEMTEHEVREFKGWCEETPNVQLDESKEYSKTFWNTDLLITDGSAIVVEYFVTKKPILFCQSPNPFRYAKYAKDMISTCYEINNSADLRKAFIKVVSGKDEKKELRIQCINKYFSNAVLNSTNIIEFLANVKQVR